MKTQEFEQAYGRLNKAQKEAVDAIEGPVMVIAGPGTGETQSLTLRMANVLLKTDTPASGILALTFTEAGQKAMKARLRQLIGSRADAVGIFTYHGFATSVIAEFQDHFPHLARSKQMTEIEAEILVRDILRDKKYSKLRPLGDPEFYLGKIIRTISDCRKEAWTPDYIRNFAKQEIERIKSDPSSISSRGATKGQIKADAEKDILKAERTIIFADIYEEYEAEKQKQKRHDFDDLIFELLDTLEKDDLLLRLLQEKYLYLLVDEHQDTNNSQNLLIKKLADFYDEPNLFVVGDEKQAIYRFQGASVQNFLEFQKIWPTMKIISLIDNYRSTQGVLDASYQMIENNYQAGEHDNLRIRLRASGPESPEPVTVVMAGNNESAEAYLVEEVKKIVEASDQSVAVIVRTNREIERALSALTSAGLSASAERGMDIFSHPVSNLCFKLWEFLADESKLESLAYTLAGGLWSLDLESASSLIRAIRSGQISDLKQKIPNLTILKKNISKTGAIEFLLESANLAGLKKIVSGDPVSAQVWRTIIDLAKDLAYSKGLEDPRLLIEELLNYRNLAENKNIKISAGSGENQVVVMTAHGSKGLEYDQVFLIYATEESWLPRSRFNYFVLPERREDEDEIRDARRLFYVALTRAKKQASIIVGLADAFERPFTPLRFIDELDQKNISRVELPKVAGEIFPEKTLSSAERDHLESWEFTKNVLLDKGLSVTALNHFCDCPSKFFFKSILKLPEAPSASSEKGNAMHEALSAVWSLPEKKVVVIHETLVNSIEDYFRHSFLASYEKEVVLDELLTNAPKVAQALQPHFAQEGKIFSEKWEETEFEGSYEGKKIRLRLHGKLDAIVETKKKVLVYDYKTKEKMSEKAIRGETKNDDGNYFRQLVFYKILLLENSISSGKEIEPALVFVKPDRKGDCPTITLPIDKKDISKVKDEIQALIESVWSGRILTDKCDDPKCEFCALRDLTR